jgi:hypothetical protein
MQVKLLLFAPLTDTIGDMAKTKKVSQPNTARTERVLVALSKSEVLGFANASKLCGLSLSTWMRSVCVEAARAALVENGKEVPFDKREG